MHNKLFLIRKGDVRTTIVSSINLTDAIETKWNNLVISRDPDMFDFFDTYFDKMRSNKWGDWNRQRADYADDDTFAKGYVYPQLDERDDAAELLNAVSACSNDTGDRISFLVAKLEEPRLDTTTDLYKALQGLPANCQMRFLIGKPGDDVVKTMREIDTEASITAKKYRGKPPHHSKYLVIDATTTDVLGGADDVAHRQYVWTGSVNLAGEHSEDGPDQGAWAAPNSNILVMGPQMWSAYQDHFDHLWSDPR